MEGDVAVIGITEHAQELLGDVVFVDMPEIGTKFDQHDTMGAVESVKAASDIYSPLSGALRSPSLAAHAPCCKSTEDPPHTPENRNLPVP